MVFRKERKMKNILNNKKAIIFDLDGTLVHLPKKILITRVKQGLKRGQLPKKTDKQILKFYKNHGWDKTLEEWNFDSIQKNFFWKRYTDYVENHEQNGTEVYEDTLPTLFALREQGKKIAIITSATKNYLQKQIEKIDKDYFNYAIYVGRHNLDINIVQKPSPEGVYYVLNHLKTNPENSVFIGDSNLDIETAKNAGCLDILIDRGNGCLDINLDEKNPINPTIKIKSLIELI